MGGKKYNLGLNPPPSDTMTIFKQAFITWQGKTDSVVLQFIEAFSIPLLSTLHKAALAAAQMNVFGIAP